MTELSGLENCPFCGAQPDTYYQTKSGWFHKKILMTIKCKNISEYYHLAMVCHENPVKAIEAWNRRANG